MTSDALVHFEAHRTTLRALAYRMLGSRSETDDVLQDAWLRWHEVDVAAVGDCRRYLLRIASNLCIDRLKSARARREQYVGVWLPEPLVDVAAGYAASPDYASEFAQDLTFALMLTLDRLTPAERAAFILHDVFGYDFEELAGILDKTSAACRQLAARARRHVKTDGPRHHCTPARAREIATAFAVALGAGDIDGLARLLAADARFIADGGGKVASVPQPVLGAAKIAKVLVGFAGLYRHREALQIRDASINGLAGFVVSAGDGSVIQTIALESNAREEISGIYVVRNPEKLIAVAGAAPGNSSIARASDTPQNPASSEL